MSESLDFDAIRKLKTNIGQGDGKYNFNSGIDEDTILLNEKAYGIKLSKSYISFLKLCNGGMILENHIEYYTDMLDDEPDGPKWSSYYFYSLDEVLDNYVGFSIDYLFVGEDFRGIYPIIPICKIPGPYEGHLLIFSEKGMNTISPVFYYLANNKYSRCIKIADNFNSFLNWHLENEGFPKIDRNTTGKSIEDFLKEKNILDIAASETNKEGVDRINSFLKLYPHDAWSYCERANLEVKLGEHKAALKDFNKAINLMDDEPFFYNCRGELHLQHGNPRKALIDMDIAVNMEPSDKLYLTSRAETFLKLGKLKEALADCNAVLEQDHQYFSALSIRFQVYKSMGEDELAQADSDLIDDLL
ncbi:MAG: hypothetical protein C0595_01875 [Marinilabiliales bacterium]|nr:MAG: hypothetical protein C0595_01875 [Marinilabiliales bacterium]